MISSKIAAILAYTSGTLLILAGATGSVGIVGTVIEYLIANLSGSAADLLSIFLHVLNVVADLGLSKQVFEKRYLKTGRFDFLQ